MVWELLDHSVSLAKGSWEDVEALSIVDGRLSPDLPNPDQFVGYRGAAARPEAVLLNVTV